MRIGFLFAILLLVQANVTLAQAQLEFGGDEQGGVPYQLDLDDTLGIDIGADAINNGTPAQTDSVNNVLRRQMTIPAPDPMQRGKDPFDINDLLDGGQVIGVMPQNQGSEQTAQSLQGFDFGTAMQHLEQHRRISENPHVQRSPVTALIENALPESDFTLPQLNKLVNNKLGWPEIIDALPEGPRFDLGMRNAALPSPDVAVQQTVPGKGTDDPPGFEWFPGPNGGVDRITRPGIGNPLPAPGECSGTLCGNPERQHLAWADVDRSAVDYAISGYPEVVFTAVFSGTDVANPIGPIKFPRCTAVMITQEWALTALHCIDFDRPVKNGVLLDRPVGQEIPFGQFSEPNTLQSSRAGLG